MIAGLTRLRFRLVRLRLLWWSLLNLCRGYQFRPVQRCRRCSHTTPYHYPTCERLLQETVE